MKRVLTMILAAALLLGMIPAAGAAFTDADKIAEGHQTAVEYVSGKGVISGFPDGSFKPKETLTRAQAAKILCVALEGAEKANALTKTDAGFTDVPDAHWAAKFVAYCVEKKIVAGVGGGRFDPDGALTAAAFAKMLLVAYGREKAENLVGEKWAMNTQKALRTDSLNEGVDVANKPTTRENACRLAYNFLLEDEIAKTEPEAYKKTTLSFRNGGSFRLLGRAEQSAEGVVCNCSADGVEFTADCKGSITLKASASSIGTNEVAFRVLVDGVPGQQVRIATAGEKTGTAYLRILPGSHTIRIVKDYEITASTDLIKSIEINCKPGTVKATQAKKKLLLVIGDSTSAGFGILGDSSKTKTTNTSSAVLTYGYRCAAALDMDYEMVVKGTTGVVKRYGTPKEYNQRELYEYRNRYREAEGKYPFPRKADAALVKLSGNDSSVAEAELEEGFRDLIRMVREHNGDIPIVFFYYNNSKHKAMLQKIIEEDPKFFGVSVADDHNGAGKHPSMAAHVRFTEEILKVLTPLVN